MATNEKVRLLIVDDNLESVLQLRQLIQADQHLEVVAHAVASLEAIRTATLEKPDVLCIDLDNLGNEGIAISEAITARLPEARVMMILPHGKIDAELLRRAMRAGVFEFLSRPFNAGDFAESVRRAQRLMPQGNGTGETLKTADAPAHAPAQVTHAQLAPVQVPPPAAPAEPSRQGEVLTVFSVVGGIGRSTIAVNLAIALKEITRGTVALVDSNLRFGDVGILLNMRTTRSMVDICTPHGGVDLELLDTVLVSHYSGVRVLLGPPSPEFGEMVTAAALGIIIRALRERFDYVVVDTHNFLDEAVLMLLDVSDRILLLTSSELPAMKNTKLFLHVADMLNYKPEKTLLVINQHNPKGRITPKDIETSIKHRVFAVIERDDNVTTQAVQTGQPFVIHQKSTGLSQALFRLASLVSSINAGNAAAAGTPRKRGLFGRLA
jgi:pilus assembly protein CpaE